MSNQTNFPQILDGFSYGTIFGRRPFQGSNYWWNAINRLTPLRIAQDDYRPRVWVVPKEFFNSNNVDTTNLLPGKTAFFQLQVRPGSFLYALNISNYFDHLNQNKFSVQIKETGTELLLFDRVIAGSAIRSGSTQDPFNTLNPPVFLLQEERLILDPGLIDVELSNDTDPNDPDNNAVPVQLILFFAEPKK